MPLVSIVTPVRNGAATVAHALSSIIDQTYPNIEIIVIDGASTDGTLDVLQSFSKGIDCWISEPDQGISDAFNKGIALCTGDIIGILNADDWYESNAMMEVVAHFAQEQCDIVSGAQQYWVGGERGQVFYSNPENLPLESTVNHAATFVKREVYRKHGLFKLKYRYAMDYDLLLRFYLAGVRFCVLADVLANMRLGGRSDSSIYPVSKELYEIKTSLLGHHVKHFVYSAYHYARTAASKQLRDLGAEDLLSGYREHYSVVKKSQPK